MVEKKLEKPKSRCPEKFIDGSWIYVHTITIKGDKEKLFLEYAGINPNKPEIYKGFSNFWCGSVHNILAQVNPVKIDVYRGRASINTSKSFQEQYGRIMAIILQVGYDPKDIRIDKDSVIVRKGKAKDLSHKLVF